MRASPSDPRAAARRASILVAEWIGLTPAVLAAQQLGPPIPLTPTPRRLAVEVAFAPGP